MMPARKTTVTASRPIAVRTFAAALRNSAASFISTDERAEMCGVAVSSRIMPPPRVLETAGANGKASGSSAGDGQVVDAQCRRVGAGAEFEVVGGGEVLEHGVEVAGDGHLADRE